MERERNRFSQEQVRQARQADLAEYLLRQGEPLIRAGSRYRHKEHDSLVFTGNSYFWNSRDDKGNAIDYLIKHQGMDFESAVMELSGMGVQGKIGKTEETWTKPPLFSFADIKLETDMRRAIAYLNKSRGIDYAIIKELVDNKLIYQEAETNNIIFPMRDETGVIVGAELCGTLTDRRFKGIKADSEYGYGFSLHGKGDARFALFFEGAIDLISFYELQRMKDSTIDKLVLVSMAGLKGAVIKQTLNRSNPPLTPVLCVDNDPAGTEFIKSISGQIKGIRTYLPEEGYKDWNEELVSKKTRAL